MRVLASYFAPLWQVRSWREYIYLMLGLPLGILWGVYAITMYSMGIALAIIWIGLVILVAMQSSLRPIGTFERKLINELLKEDLPAPAPRTSAAREPGDQHTVAQWGRWLHTLVHDVHSWNVLAWVLGRLILGPIGFVIALLAIVMPITLIATVVISALVQSGVMPEPGDVPQAVDLTHTVAFWVLVGSPVIIAVLPMFAWGSRGFAYFYRVMARRALGPCREQRTAAATARAQLAEEQVRIDQELHDSIGHMITMNIVQAGAGAHVFDSDPEFARQALRNIEERGRAAMGELDRIVATIRGDQPEARTPLPGYGDIGRLITTARAAGIDVEASVESIEVPPALGRTTFGIVREALTNVGKHAPGARVQVTVGRDADALAIAVRNEPSPRPDDAVGGPAHTADRAGLRHGVSGMRDRVALLGGRSEIAPRADGGFAVLALLPLEAQLSADDAAYALWDSNREDVRA